MSNGNEVSAKRIAWVAETGQVRVRKRKVGIVAEEAGGRGEGE